jgi:multiple sugar transport system substrate-binding protein
MEPTTARNPRYLLRALVVAGVSAIALTGCVATSGDTGGGVTQDPGAPIVMQSRFTDEAKGGLPALIEAYQAQGGGEVTLNTTPSENFRSQLPTFLTAKNPPDLYTWFAGQATRSFADSDLLLDLSSVWDESMQNYPEALRELSQNSAGDEVFIPTNYYWVGVYYQKSVFERLGVTPPETWDEFKEVCAEIQAQGVTPITSGIGDNAWMAAHWFDYLNLRINGAEFHLDLLSGAESFTDERVVKVFEAWEEILPYFDPNLLGVPFQQSVTDFAQGTAAMYLVGAWIQGSVPEETQEDLAFFRFPIIDPSIPIAEEGPTDGFFVSANSTHQAATLDFLNYLASPDGAKVYMAAQGDTSLSANPDVDIDLSPLAQQGKELLESATALTQFFNRDAGDELQPAADAALTQFLAQPENIEQILADWQAASERARQGQ